MILKTRATRMTSRKLSNLEEELNPLLARVMSGAASSKESERIQTIFSLCRQANKLEQYRVWHSQVKALGTQASCLPTASDAVARAKDKFSVQ